MSDEDSSEGSEGEHTIKVAKEEWKNGAPLHVEAEEELLENQQIYTPLRLLIKKKVVDPERRSIPASLFERLAFYRAYCTTPSKSYFICWRGNVVGDLVYMNFVFTTLLTCLGLYFVEIFLGVFASEHHIFITKMVPLAYGMSAMYLFACILELTRYTDFLGAFLDYFLNGLFYRLPWNSCTSIKGLEGKIVTYENQTYPFKCMNLNEFSAVHKHDPAAISMSGDNFTCYISNITGTCNQLSHISYIMNRGSDIERKPLIVFTYFMVIWGASLAWHKQIYRRALFRALTITQMIFCSCYFTAMTHVKLFTEVPSVPRKPVIEMGEDTRKSALLWDLVQFVLGATTFSPPILHLLSSRCRKVKPSSESLYMALGNITLILFRAWTNIYVHTHLDHLLNGFMVELYVTSCFVYPCLYYWLIYFAAQKLGHFYCLLYLLINFLYEYLTMVITVQCMIEIFVSEFKFAKRWLTTAVIFVLALCIYMLLYNERHLLTFLCKLLILILECVALFAMYPMQRLLDDIMFYYGVHPSKFRYLNMLFIPASECALLISSVIFVKYEVTNPYINPLKIYILLVGFMGIPLIAGIVYTIIKYLHFNQKQWTMMFSPIRGWGPSNFIARQLRKEFDSTEFIESQAPRVLSRYLMKNAEPDTYKLDIIYERSNLRPAYSEEFEMKKFD